NRFAKGMSLIEVLVALALVTVVMFAALTYIGTAYRGSINNNEKDFATQKAISIIDEMKSFVENTSGGGTVLDNFSDASPWPVLTTQVGIDDIKKINGLPLSPTSGNILLSGPSTCSDMSSGSTCTFKYYRQITVQQLGSEENRLVNVKIYTHENGQNVL